MIICVLLCVFSLIDYLETNYFRIMAVSLRRLLSRSLSSTSSSSSTSPLVSSIIHSKEIHASKDYSKWNIPSQPIELIYSIDPLSIKTAFSIKIHEETISLNDQCKTF